jgi:hypothetical protein
MSDQNQPSSVGHDALISRDRIRGASKIIRDGTAAADVTAEQIQTVANDVEIFRRAHHLNRRDIATAIGYSPSVVTEFLAGKYAGDRGQVAIDLEAWLTEEESRRARTESTSFVWTNVAQLIKATGMYAMDFKSIALCYSGEATGMGKTISLKAIHQELGPRRSALVTIDKVDANPTALLRKLLGAMRLGHEGSNHQRFNRLVKELKGRSHLLLIDQIHNLFGAKGDKPLFILTDLWDATESAQLWSATNDVVAYLNRQRTKSADESLAQIRRRIFPCINLMEALRGQDGGGGLLVTIEQVHEMFHGNQLRLVRDVERFLCKLINLPDRGGVGLAVQLVQYATMIGKLTGKSEVDLPMIREALTRCLPVDRAETLLHEIENPPARTAKVA